MTDVEKVFKKNLPDSGILHHMLCSHKSVGIDGRRVCWAIGSLLGGWAAACASQARLRQLPRLAVVGGEPAEVTARLHK